jgi:hypothetical protein
MKAVRAALVLLGILMIGFALVSAAGSPDLRAGRHGLFLAGVLLFHDALLMPVFLGVGAVLARTVPGRARATVQAGLIVTAAVTVVALPLLTGFGRRRDLPSVLPRDYVGGYALLLAMTWGCVVGLEVSRSVRRRRAHPAVTPRPGAEDAED